MIALLSLGASQRLNGPKEKPFITWDVWRAQMYSNAPQVNAPATEEDDDDNVMLSAETYISNEVNLQLCPSKSFLQDKKASPQAKRFSFSKIFPESLKLITRVSSLIA